MVDFSSVNVSSNPGVATLINPQYIASVKHNKGYQSVSFGDGQNSYHIVDRNEHSSSDLHTPRLDKLVTEVAPATVTSSSTADILNLQNTRHSTGLVREVSIFRIVRVSDIG